MAQQSYGEWMRSNPENPKNQTAVEWLTPNVHGLMLQLANRKISERKCELKLFELFDQAKEMEKQQQDNWNKFLETEKTLGISDVKTIERIQWYYNQYFNQTHENK